jgi:Flp pilus assembly protein TadB
MSEKQILDKLDDIQRDQKTSSALSNASFGLAVSAIGISVALNITSLALITMCVIVACIGLAGFIWNIFKWRISRPKE